MIANKKHLSYLVLFLWISFTIHMYAFWGVSTLATMHLQQVNDNQKNQPQQQIHNIILETKTETPDTSQESVISDKNNRSQAPTQDLSKPEEYNVANPYLAQGQGRGGEASYVPQEEVQGDEQKVQDTKITEAGVQISQNKTQKQVASEGGGETAPTLMDVKKKQVINLYNNGAASLSTKSKDYAEYFLNMQKKIEKYHREFFPIYQYYQGLLKDGEVVVEYTLNQQGDIIDAKVISSIGSSTVDEASLNSIVYARNFGTLPEDLQDDDVTIHFHFIYLSR